MPTATERLFGEKTFPPFPTVMVAIPDVADAVDDAVDDAEAAVEAVVAANATGSRAKRRVEAYMVSDLELIKRGLIK